MNLDRLHVIKNAIRSKYAWPGGYPIFLQTHDGEALSIDAAKENWKNICRAIMQNDLRSEWYVTDALINYEDANLYCCHTSTRIESAYAEDDEASVD
jgi:hypothetical protein